MSARFSGVFGSALSVLFLFISLSTSVAADEEKAMLSLEEIVALRIVTGAWLSPNADLIAYVLSVPRALYEDEDGPAWTQLHLVNLDGESRAYFSGKVTVSEVAWARDGSALYFIGKRDVEAEFPSIYRIPVNGGEAEVVYEGESDLKSLRLSPTGNTLAFLAPEPKPEEHKTLAEKGFKALVYEESVLPVRIWLLDIETGEALAQDLAGSVSNLQWSPDGRFYAVAVAPTPLIDDEYMARDLLVVSAEDAAIRNRMGLDGKLGSFAWSPDGEQLAWIGGEDRHDPSEGRLYSASSSGGERNDMLPNYEGQVEDFYWRDGSTIAWLGARGVWTETGHATIEQGGAAGEAPAAGPIIRSLDAFAGSETAAAVADSPLHPPEVYLIRRGQAPLRLTDSNPLLNERQPARQEAIRYRARDGLELDAILVHPPQKPSSDGSPMVMMIHGGPESHYSNGWMSSYSRPAQALASQGYLVAYPNYRGSTGRGVAFSKMGQNDYAAAEFNDIVDAKQHLVELGLADPDKTGITGGSYGGYASMWAASALSEHFAAAVAFVGISDQISKFGTTDIPNEMYNVHSRAWPWEDWEWMLKRSPVYHADKVRTPLLIMHGAKDPRVHPSQSLEMYRYVKVRTDTPVRLVYYPDEGHGNRNTAAQYDYALRLDRWMNHYLKGPGGQVPPYEIDHAARLKDSAEESP
jgi:dipeptidyl aminopeptidase/acylaminoacyl peptidase